VLTPDPNFIIPDWEPWPAQYPGAPSAIVRQGSNVPVIALTIDDGNFPDGCRQEFGYLSANHIPATFFPDWVGVHKDPDLWQEIAAAGYPIANHTLTHLNLAGPDVEDHSVQRQLAQARERIEADIGRSMLPIWRPPYGAYDARDLRIAGELGLHTMILWSASDADSGPNSKPEGMIRAALRAKPGDILLTHCNTQTSADILPAIVQGLLAEGYTFVTIPDLLRPYGLGG
jgi:peptidoglycan/xylan/chitin deacetylase (PgdA/CDA1 family)